MAVAVGAAAGVGVGGAGTTNTLSAFFEGNVISVALSEGLSFLEYPSTVTLFDQNERAPRAGDPHAFIDQILRIGRDGAGLRIVVLEPDRAIHRTRQERIRALRGAGGGGADGPADPAANGAEGGR